MVSVHRPLHLRSSKKMTLAATEEFWHSPIADDASDSDSGSNDAALSLPPAHHQLLSRDGPSFENLKGHDHSSSYDDLDGYATSDSDSPTFNCRRKLSAVKQQGGGSWLLGFARLSNEKAAEPQDDMSDDEDMAPPGLVRVPSGSSLDEESSSDESDDESAVASTPVKPRRAGVSFSECVTVQAIPHSSTLSPLQRRKMYSTSFEVRQNKIRNKKEYRYDGYDWRNVTEEWEMGVDMVTGELVHPVHEQA